MAYQFGQKFVTTDITDGCRIHVIQDNEYNHNGTIPTHLLLKLFTWNSTYTNTILGSIHVQEDVVVASEEIEDAEMWLYMMWKPLPAGTYLWHVVIQSDASDETGVFQILYDPDSTKSDSYEDVNNTPLAGDFDSEIFRLGSGIYENVLTVGDTFGSYQVGSGVSSVKANRGGTYTNVIKVQSAVTNGYRKTGRIASGSRVELGI